jgi:carboxypeptidase Q
VNRTPIPAPRRARCLAAALVFVSVLTPPALAQQAEQVDAAAMARIRDEGFQRSQIMDVMSYLTDVYGARLTGSPAAKAAGEWTVGKLRSWGITNPRFESWGPFGRGWVNERFSAQVTAPMPYPVIAYPAAWSPSTSGAATGEVVMVRIDSLSDLEHYRGKLRGKWIMMGAAPELEPHFQPQAHRFTTEELEAMAAPVTQQGGGARRGGGRRGGFGAFQELARRRTQFFVDEGALGVLSAGRGDGGTVFTGGAMPRDVNAPAQVPAIVLSSEHYGRIARTLEKGVPVTFTATMQNRFIDGDLSSFNIVAEIPGTDPRLRDELVMLGAHFDSWHAGTGATDNAAGSAVMLEAMRILKATRLPLKRTVRLALWTGEEQGLLGSRAYVREHFGYIDSTGAHLRPEAAKVSAYFNLDNGTGAIRGVYQQGNAAVGPIFAKWLEPFADLGASTLTMRNTGGTDHLSFDAVGIPGFQFIQDPVEYGTRTHHSNQDVYERIQPKDMMQNAVIVAAFVYDAANRAEKLPRKALP